jgi:indolepyruvate ferredoxin oxidoreductase, beta subunit
VKEQLMRRKVDFVFAGVGGQGTILATDVLSDVGLESGFDVKKSEVHGMSQRGGSVESHVRWSNQVASPLALRGSVDYLVGLEMLEGARWAQCLSPHATVIVNRYRLYPLVVSAGTAEYPSEEEIVALLTANGAKLFMVDASAQAVRLGNVAVASVVVLGFLSAHLEVEETVWLSVIERRVPERFRELNLEAFAAGRALAAVAV